MCKYLQALDLVHMWYPHPKVSLSKNDAHKYSVMRAVPQDVRVLLNTIYKPWKIGRSWLPPLYTSSSTHTPQSFEPWRQD